MIIDVSFTEQEFSVIYGLLMKERELWRHVNESAPCQAARESLEFAESLLDKLADAETAAGEKTDEEANEK